MKNIRDIQYQYYGLTNSVVLCNTVNKGPPLYNLVTISLCDKINNSSKFISKHLLTQFDHVQSVVSSNNWIASMQNVPFIVSMQMNTVLSTLHICRSISVENYRTRDYFHNRNILRGEAWFFFSFSLYTDWNGSTLMFAWWGSLHTDKSALFT